MWRRVGVGGLRDSGTIRRTLPLENFTHPREADLLWWSLRRVSLFPKLWLFKALQSGQLTAEGNMTRHTQRGWEIERKNAPRRSWAAFLCKRPEEGPCPPGPCPPRPGLGFAVCLKARSDLLTLHHWAGGRYSSWYCMLPLLLPHSFSLAALWEGVCFNLFSVITVYISQRDTVLECRRSEFKTKQT